MNEIRAKKKRWFYWSINQNTVQSYIQKSPKPAAATAYNYHQIRTKRKRKSRNPNINENT